MEILQVVMAGLTAIILFVFGLENFSKEIERISGEHFRKSLSAATKIPIMSVIIGALVTMVIQSSSATSVITISLVNAGVLSFKNSVGIIFGSNIGTTITAQLVAFKLTNFAPFLILLGFVVTILRNRVSIFGKAIFYFGFVFFSLNLISTTLQPLQQNEALISILTQPQNPLYAIAFGCIFTAIVQSSSVTTGLAIIFTQQGLIGLENAVPLILGANIGTTATAFIAVFSMDIAAKKAALSHFLFNVGGVLLFLPALYLYGDRLSEFTESPAIALANIHLVFNIVASLVFTIFIGPFTRFVDYLLGEGKMDFERLELPILEDEDNFISVKEKLEDGSDRLFYFLQENYNAVTLSVETNFQGIYDAADKRIQYIDFLKKEYLHFFAKAVSLIKEKDESKALIKIINQFDYLFQIHDSIKDLFESKRVMKEQYIELKSDLLMLTRGLSMQTIEYFNEITTAKLSRERNHIKAHAKELQHEIDSANRSLLLLMIDPSRADAGALTNFITYSQRLKDKLTNYSYLYLDMHAEQHVTDEDDDKLAPQPAV
ncbi:Na/Pi symporter [Aliiglaciecola sp. LCG003]|uniref:Na/Pi cotransporter family protein n=1 Tax=Aliiglaciecola sp. LCG003 TaxID=3053655 RepID=UPI002573A6DB|nr:Na/Pi symporter [Aliiglaciecola sp. LCG003]WJG10702.1 Na/Pi symporter [Aliiglaciecola sp. LCG003]